MNNLYFVNNKIINLILNKFNSFRLWLRSTVDRNFVLFEIFFRTEDNSCSLREIQLNEVASVLPRLSDYWEEKLLRHSLKSIVATKFVIISFQ